MPSVGSNTLSLKGGGSAMYKYASHGGTPVVVSATAKISPADLDTGSEPGDTAREYVRNIGEDHDDAGHILANRLGGPAVPTNLFPQNPHINRGVYEHFEAKIYPCVQKGQATLSWEFTYDSDSDTRPSRVKYSYSGSGCSDMSREFNNPHDGTGDTAQLIV
jgi:hypothetical protein